MDYNNILSNILIQKDNQKSLATIKTIHKNIKEYIRWIEYVPSFEAIKLNNIFQKKSIDLTKEELIYLLNYKKNLSILKRLKVYETDNCTADDVAEVTNYINSNELISIIEAKLTESELKKVSELFEEADKLSIEELEIINQENKQFTKGKIVSAIDSVYALKVKELYEEKSFMISTRELEDKIKYQNRLNPPYLSGL